MYQGILLLNDLKFIKSMYILYIRRNVITYLNDRNVSPSWSPELTFY